jgi:hypothetical protein
LTVAGKVRELIDRYYEKRAHDNPTMAHFVRAQLILKGIDPDKFNEKSEDNPDVIRKLTQLLREFN